MCKWELVSIFIEIVVLSLQCLGSYNRLFAVWPRQRQRLFPLVHFIRATYKCPVVLEHDSRERVAVTCPGNASWRKAAVSSTCERKLLSPSVSSAPSLPASQLLMVIHNPNLLPFPQSLLQSAFFRGESILISDKSCTFCYNSPSPSWSGYL